MLLSVVPFSQKEVIGHYWPVSGLSLPSISPPPQAGDPSPTLKDSHIAAGTIGPRPGNIISYARVVPTVRDKRYREPLVYNIGLVT